MLDAHHIIANNGSNSHSTNSKPKPPKKKKGAKPSQNMFPFSCFMAFLEESIYSEKNAASNCNNSISLSPEHTLLKAGGNGKWGGGSGVKSYGIGKRGQLGHGTRDDVAVPKPIQPNRLQNENCSNICWWWTGPRGTQSAINGYRAGSQLWLRSVRSAGARLRPRSNSPGRAASQVHRSVGKRESCLCFGW